MAGFGFFDKMPRESQGAAAPRFPPSGGNPGTPRGPLPNLHGGNGLYAMRGAGPPFLPQASPFMHSAAPATATAPVDDGIRVRRPLRPGQSIELNGNILKPLDGPKGYGVYVESEESDDIVDFYPCEQGHRVSTRSRQRSTSHGPFASLDEGWVPERPGMFRAQSSEGRIQGSPYGPPQDYGPPQPSYIPFDAPWERPGPPDPLDPKWKAMFGKLMSGSTEGMDDEAKFQLGMNMVVPMLQYVRGIDGVVASDYHAQLAGLADELGVSRTIEHTQPRRFMGMPERYK